MRGPSHGNGRILGIGSGYVGLTTAACLAHLGYQVHSTDISESGIGALNAGEVPILEPGLGLGRPVHWQALERELIELFGADR